MVWGLPEQVAQDLGLPWGHLCPPAQVLDLSHNELSFVPPDLPETLEELRLQSNRISHVGPEAFLSTPNLRALFLRCPESGWMGLGGKGGLWWAAGDPSKPSGLRVVVAPSPCLCPHAHLLVQGQQASHDQHCTRGLLGPPTPACGGHNRKPRAGPGPAATHSSTSASGLGSLSLRDLEE